MAVRLMATKECRKDLREVLNQIVLDGYHRSAAVDIYFETGKHPKTEGHLCMRAIMRRDVAYIKHAELIKLSKVRNTSSAQVRCEPTLADALRAVVYFYDAVDLEYVVKLGDVRLNYTSDDSLSSRYLAIRTAGAYVRHIRFAEVCLKESILLFLLDRLSTKGQSRRDVGISHPGSSAQHISQHGEVELMVGSADCSMKCLTKSSRYMSCALILPLNQLLHSCPMYTINLPTMSIPLSCTSRQ